MKKIRENLNLVAFMMTQKAFEFKKRAAEKINEEDGDTNFLSILIVLAIVLVVAVLFIGFKDQIVGLVTGAFEDFTNAFGGGAEG